MQQRHGARVRDSRESSSIEEGEVGRGGREEEKVEMGQTMRQMPSKALVSKLFSSRTVSRTITTISVLESILEQLLLHYCTQRAQDLSIACCTQKSVLGCCKGSFLFSV